MRDSAAPALVPLAAFDVAEDGRAVQVADPWPAPVPAEGFAWRWLHCDRTAATLVRWASENLPPPVRSALIEPESRPRCDASGDGLVLALRGVNHNRGQEEEDMVALRLWVTSGLIVSTRLRPTHAHDALLADMAGGTAPATPGAFLVRLTDRLTARIADLAAQREERVDAVEELVLDDAPDRLGEGETEIARLARSVIKLRRYVAPQREALYRLSQIETPAVTPAERLELREIANRAARSVEELDALRDRLTSLRDHVNAVHSARIGRNSFVLSIVAAIFLPLSLVTSLWGVNLQGIPGTGHPSGFAILAGVLAVLGLGLWLLFRRMRWF